MTISWSDAKVIKVERVGDRLYVDIQRNIQNDGLGDQTYGSVQFALPATLDNGKEWYVGRIVNLTAYTN